MNWNQYLLTTPDRIEALLAGLRRVAVLGIRSEQFAQRPAHYVAAALQRMGLEIVPVPVYERELPTILGQRCYHQLVDIPGAIDLVDVFRRAEDIPPHLPDLIAKRPAAVWFQTGIHHAAAAEQLARAGIAVVQNDCLMVEYRRHHLARLARAG
jgi:predicted CoA-binding protein